MKRAPIALLSTAAVAILMAVPANAVPIHRHVTRTQPLGLRAVKVPYVEVVKVDVAPLDSDEDGFANTEDGCPSIASTTNGGCLPEPVAASVSESVAPTPAYGTVAPASGGSGCVGMEAESGSAGYSAYNPSSGATGCYQVLPSTAAAYGCDLSTPTGQDSCKDAICAEQGNGAWASSGATPC